MPISLVATKYSICSHTNKKYSKQTADGEIQQHKTSTDDPRSKRHRNQPTTRHLTICPLTPPKINPSKLNIKQRSSKSEQKVTKP